MNWTEQPQDAVSKRFPAASSQRCIASWLEGLYSAVATLLCCKLSTSHFKFFETPSGQVRQSSGKQLSNSMCTMNCIWPRYQQAEEANIHWVATCSYHIHCNEFQDFQVRCFPSPWRGLPSCPVLPNREQTVALSEATYICRLKVCPCELTGTCAHCILKGCDSEQLVYLRLHQEFMYYSIIPYMYLRTNELMDR